MATDCDWLVFMTTGKSPVMKPWRLARKCSLSTRCSLAIYGGSSRAKREIYSRRCKTSNGLSSILIPFHKTISKSPKISFAFAQLIFICSNILVYNIVVCMFPLHNSMRHSDLMSTTMGRCPRKISWTAGKSSPRNQATMGI